MSGSGGGNLPNNFKNYLKSWQEKNPDYEIKEWNEKNFDFSKSPYALEAYKSKKYGHGLGLFSILTKKNITLATSIKDNKFINVVTVKK